MHLWNDPDGNPMDSLSLGEAALQPGEALNWSRNNTKLQRHTDARITNYEVAPIFKWHDLQISNIGERKKTRWRSRAGELAHTSIGQ